MAELLEQANHKTKAGKETPAAATQSYSGAAHQVLVRQVGHNLAKAWRRFKALHPSVDFSNQLDEVVAGLDKWWHEQRYPGFPSGSVVSMSFSLVKGSRPTPLAGAPDDTFYLSLAEMDELFARSVPLVWNAGLIRSSIMPFPRQQDGPIPGIAAYEWQNSYQVDLGPATPPDTGS